MPDEGLRACPNCGQVSANAGGKCAFCGYNHLTGNHGDEGPIPLVERRSFRSYNGSRWFGIAVITAVIAIFGVVAATLFGIRGTINEATKVIEITPGPSVREVVAGDPDRCTRVVTRTVQRALKAQVGAAGDRLSDIMTSASRTLGVGFEFRLFIEVYTSYASEARKTSVTRAMRKAERVIEARCEREYAGE